MSETTKGGEVKAVSQVADRVMTITLVDEVGRNVLGMEMMQQLSGALAAATSDPAVHAIVVTNRGKVFCAGADLKATPGVDATSRFVTLLQAIQHCPKPVVGRIAGHAVGGGVGLAAAFDISIASREAGFGFSEVRLGLVPAVISVTCLPKMRPADAMEVFLRGDRFPASRAAELGLITRAVAAEDLDGEIAAVLADLRLGGPKALGVAKHLVRSVPAMPEDQAYVQMAKLSAEIFGSEEGQAGATAFANRKPPPWVT